MTNLLRLWLAICGLTLTLSTWKLWTPQDVFPQVPLFAFAIDWPLWLDWVGFAGIVIAYLALFTFAVIGLKNKGMAEKFLPSFSACLLLLVSTLLMVTLDQNRLQVWVYHFGIASVLLTLPTADRSLVLIRWLTASIYFWSAISKLDKAFMESMGPYIFNEGLLKATGLIHLFPGGFQNWLTLLLPGYELLIGIAVFTKRFQRLGLIASLVMHVLLLITFSPWGLNHSRGVLLWNVYFLGQNSLLLYYVLKASGGHQPAVTPNQEDTATTANQQEADASRSPEESSNAK
ncbi:MauE/DoxX family redox-associated membrane protein [Calycomorphotria hydatis]|uniref:MauE/DoxX family redox-associated membrane protein n=1 Tax=Calycomorphotria hydatis TaxID=2528027 RepID=UPI0011A930E3|nr:MauE/DoxX family redox-associated membrane protein [Calycomorphotria hydatis]